MMAPAEGRTENLPPSCGCRQGLKQIFKGTGSGIDPARPAKVLPEISFLHYFIFRMRISISGVSFSNPTSLEVSVSPK